MEVLPADMKAEAKAKLNKKAHTNIEVKFGDEDLALLLLTSLPESYEYFVDTCLYGRDALTLEGVMATLNSKEIKQRSKAKGDNGKGLYVRRRSDHRDSHQSRRKSRSKSRGKRLKCYICQSEDHLKRNCMKNNRKKSTCYVKKEDYPSFSGSIYDGSKVMSEEALLDWIMDSSHDTHVRFIFYFLECNGGSVLLGDNRECKIKGIGKNLKGLLRILFGGRVVVDELNAGNKEKDSLAQVWHKRLGYISEARLQAGAVWQEESRNWALIVSLGFCDVVTPSNPFRVLQSATCDAVKSSYDAVT
uniref:Retrovirus-related Pol polyprotein from transposon TNT 1-94 n=1 Tax=Tanacetum cinerariifolium TaxID=118510 RepID=A0A6L2LC84_TANCI|nr:retrovirus-related Pol polyprotein from transposon TNT 1-94 [Tanacetum cinerariifolium]